MSNVSPLPSNQSRSSFPWHSRPPPCICTPEHFCVLVKLSHCRNLNTGSFFLPLLLCSCHPESMLHHGATHTVPNSEHTCQSASPPKLSSDIFLSAGGLHSLWPKSFPICSALLDTALHIMCCFVLVLLSFGFHFSSPLKFLLRLVHLCVSRAASPAGLPLEEAR